MTVDAPRASLRPAGTGPETALARCRGPAWVIDPAKGRVLAANAAGAARMGLHPDAACGTLDASMPGLVRLRALVREPLNGGRREPLIFWTAYGAESLDCTVRAIPEQPSSGLVLVSIAGIGDRELAETKEPALAETAPPAPAETPAATNDDAATLKRIAHAIRTGFVRPAEAPEETPAEEPEAATASQAERAAYVSKLAHELRTPLSAIMLASEIMKEQRFGKMTNARYRGYTNDIHDNARHALAVVDRLLGDEPSEEGPERLDEVELNLNTLAERSVSAMRPLADEAGLRLKFERHARLPKVIADSMSVKQILFNLLANAIKFTPAKGEIRVVTGLGYEGGVFVAVKDTGPGMDAKAIARALDTEAKPERTQAGGHGIGLPLAANLATANGARLEIDSEPGEGTAIALVFPQERLAKRK